MHFKHIAFIHFLFRLKFSIKCHQLFSEFLNFFFADRKTVDVIILSPGAVSTSAIDTGVAGSARCNYCETDVNFKSGKAALLVHSEWGKHITNTKKKMNSVKHQITIRESLQVSQDKDEEDVRLEEKRREFERSVCLGAYLITKSLSSSWSVCEIS